VRRFAAALTALLVACAPGAEPKSATEPSIADDIAISVESVLDGDSLRVIIDGREAEIRLLGINAPERGECWSNEARAALEDASTGGVLSVVGDEEDRYGRLLAYLLSGSANINRLLVLDGNAMAIAVRHDKLPDFLAAEEEAIGLERGLWNPAACGSTAGRFDVRIRTIEPDAPGRDDRNPNGEFVVLTNEGPVADLTGWTLRDESSVHRYAFPSGFILATGETVTVRSGCGEDTRLDLYWCAAGPVWTNSGDTVLLLDDFGAVADRIRYLED